MPINNFLLSNVNLASIVKLSPEGSEA